MIEFDRTPVWHASISIQSIDDVGSWNVSQMGHARLLADKILAGRGDVNHLDIEVGRKALHVRRKINDAEKSIIGPAQTQPGVPSE